MRPLRRTLRVGRVDRYVRPATLDRAIAERLSAAVDLFAKPTDLALGDAGHPQRFDEIVERSRRDALDIGLLHVSSVIGDLLWSSFATQT